MNIHKIEQSGIKEGWACNNKEIEELTSFAGYFAVVSIAFARHL